MQPLQDLVQGAVDQTVAETTVAQIFECYFVYSCLMPKAAESVANLPISVQVSLKVLGEHLRLGRKRRKESLRSWTLRMNVSVPTFVSMERGDPRVSMGVYATALWLIGQDDALRTLAASENDVQALAKEMLVIQNLPLARGVFVPKEHNMAAGAVDDSRPDRWGERIIRNLYKPPPRLSVLEFLYFAGHDRFGALGVSAVTDHYQPCDVGALPGLGSLAEMERAIAAVLAGEKLNDSMARLVRIVQTHGLQYLDGQHR